MSSDFSLLNPKSRLALQTRAQHDVVNEINREAVPDGHLLAIEEYKKRYPRNVHRPVGPTATYNCHGLTFASRRTQIWEPLEIQKILQDDEYVEIARGDIMIGDTAVYYDELGDISHSGPVVEISVMQGLGIRQVKILSKWGVLDEVIHLVQDGPYSALNVKYYRIEK